MLYFCKFWDLMVACTCNACKIQLKLNNATDFLCESSHAPERGVIGKNWNYVRKYYCGSIVDVDLSS